MISLYPKVSVCMPVYNGERYIAQAVGSVLSQTYSNFELILVNDSSRDHSLDVIKTFTDDRIRLFTNSKRVGQVPNYNESVRRARGDFIKVMHQDDLLEPHCLEVQTQTLRAHPDCAFVFSDSKLIDYRSLLIWERKMLFGKPGKIDPLGIAEEFLKRRSHNFIGEPPVVMFRRDVVETLGLFNEDIPMHNDIEFWIRMNSRFKCFYVNQLLSSFRVHTKQLTQKYLANPFLMLWDRWRLLFALFQYPDLPREYKVQAVRDSLRWAPGYLKGEIERFRHALAAGDYPLS